MFVNKSMAPFYPCRGTISIDIFPKIQCWDIRADSWESFPVAQQWFATGEAISHLRYLEENGDILRRTDAGVVKFELA